MRRPKRWLSRGEARREPLTVAAVLGQNRLLKGQPARISHGEWEATVGEKLARRTEATGVVSGVLTVKVSSPAWAQELSLLSDAILARLRSRGQSVQSLRFQIDAELQPKPKLTRSSSMHRDNSAENAAPEPLPLGLLRSLEQVADNELRLAIAHAASQGLRLRRAAADRLR